jgi:hypothetical protein
MPSTEMPANVISFRPKSDEQRIREALREIRSYVNEVATLFDENDVQIMRALWRVSRLCSAGLKE